MCTWISSASYIFFTIKQHFNSKGSGLNDMFKVLTKGQTETWLELWSRDDVSSPNIFGL